jgi:hypothetical protein
MAAERSPFTRIAMLTWTRGQLSDESSRVPQAPPGDPAAARVMHRALIVARLVMPREAPADQIAAVLEAAVDGLAAPHAGEPVEVRLLRAVLREAAPAVDRAEESRRLADLSPRFGVDGRWPSPAPAARACGGAWSISRLLDSARPLPWRAAVCVALTEWFDAAPAIAAAVLDIGPDEYASLRRRARAAWWGQLPPSTPAGD